MRIFPLIAAGLIAVGTLGACAPEPKVTLDSEKSSNTNIKSSSTVEPSSGPTEIITLNKGDSPPSLTGPMLDGSQFDLSDHKGKVVVLDFWGLWCPSCVRMLPELRSVSKEFAGKDVALIGVNTDELKADELKGKLEKAEVTWPQILLGTVDSPITDSWGVYAFPTVIVIDKQGKIDSVDPVDLSATIKKLL